MKLTELTKIIEDPSLILPIGGVDYEVPPCSAKTWIEMQEHQHRIELRIKAAAADEGHAIEEIGREDDPTGIDLYRIALGPAYNQMLTAGVSIVKLTVAGMTAYLWQIGSTEAAQAMWSTGGKALAAAAAALDSKTLSDRAGAAATTTPRSTSGSGTTSRKPRKATAKKASRTRSPRSSPTAN